MDLSGATAVVTGGAKRIGRHVATCLAERGTNIVLNYWTSASEAEEAVTSFQKVGVGALSVQADVSEKDGVQRVLDAAIRAFGSVQILINNAAIYYETPFEKLREEDFDRIISVNLKGPYLGCWLFGAYMRDQGCGKIINVADWAVDRPYSGYAPYFVAKGGVVALTKAFAKELAPQVQVNAVAPGPILLPKEFSPEMVRAVEEATPLRRVGDPDDVAKLMLYMIEGTDFVTGAVIPVDGGRQIS